MDLELRIKQLETQRNFLLNECKQKSHQIETLIKEIQKLKTKAIYK